MVGGKAEGREQGDIAQSGILYHSEVFDRFRVLLHLVRVKTDCFRDLLVARRRLQIFFIGGNGVVPSSVLCMKVAQRLKFLGRVRIHENDLFVGNDGVFCIAAFCLALG